MSLAIRDLEKKHPGGRDLFRGLTVELRDAEFVAVVGPSGCGKSSLLRLIAGIDSISRGEIRKSDGSLGFVFQEPRLLSWRTVRENLSLPFEIQKRPLSEEALVKVLNLVRLPDSTLELFPHQLSGGMKMRVALARALLIRPAFLLMDEPLAALDESTRQILQEEISRIHESEKRQTIFVTHSLSEALFLADRILILGPNGELKKDFQVNLPRPRAEGLRASPEFVRLLTDLQRGFRSLLADSRAKT